MSRTTVLAYALPAAMAAIAAFFTVALPAGYHDFADHSVVGGLHPFGDTASNLAFLAAGLFILFRARTASEFWLAGALCATCFGSWYYHLRPDDARLLMDRMPMAPAFAAMGAIVLFDRDERRGLTYTGIWSVLFMAAAAYALSSGNQSIWISAQVYVLLLLVVAALTRPDMRAAAIAAFGLYVGAKAFEGLDHEIQHLTGFVSGHTIKHVLAALAPVMWFALWRRPAREGWLSQCCRSIERASAT